ncbi:MAG TPA: protein kinase [Terriglobales bacterium]|jgi:serine/threonine protein kinase/Tol biopolymer transport system component
MTLIAGMILGQYEIRSPLGAGGMGEVYRAHDTRLDREVAIKVLPAALTSDPDRLRRFEQEARAAASLNHPNILAVYQMATHDGLSYMVSELLEGETLRERMRRGPIPLRKAIDYEVQIAHGLAAAHDKGIVHRDLKPENLFITKDGRVKILDFGLAKLTPPKDDTGQMNTLTQGTDPGMVVGTVGYMSPEQVRGKVADHRSDIFAFGTILYETVTGKQTFRKPTSAETMSAILNEEPEAISQLTPSVPPGLERVVRRCLEKAPEQRFQSASDLAFALEALSDSAIASPTGIHPHESSKPKRRGIALAGVAVVIVLAAAAALAYFRMQPPAPPVLSNYVQLTHDGQPKGLGPTDGSRLYMGVFGKGLAEMSVAGGEPQKLSILPSANMSARSLSPDGSELLAVDGKGVSPTGPLWIVPILGGSPRRLGDLVGNGGDWSPDGKRLAYSDASNIYLANADGTGSHKLVALNNTDVVQFLVWSPDGDYLRFTEVNFNTNAGSIWQVSADGTNLRRMVSGCCGRWTADGEYFVFLSHNQVWTLPQKGAWLRPEPKPVQLTSSPMALWDPIPSKDGKKLFVVGATTRGQLMSYDLKSHGFVPFLAGISAEYVAFSKDGQWAAYVSYPEGALWRSKADGSDPLQLTYSSDYAYNPRWSSDGKEILFYETSTGKPSRIYEVSADGGSPRQLLPDDPSTQQDPNWSPDGSKVVFAGKANDPASAVRILDLKSGKVSTLPDSQGFFSPRWSPDGRYIPALSSDERVLSVFDLQTQKWVQLMTGTISWLNWSKDGKSLIVFDGNPRTGAVLKVRLSDAKVEQIVDLKNFAPTGHYGYSLAVAPDDSPLLLRDAGTYDVYSLDWQEP